MESSITTISQKSNNILEEIKVIYNPQDYEIDISKDSNVVGVFIYDIAIKSPLKKIEEPITLQWKVPAINIKGVWKPNSDFDKRIQPNWETDNMDSRISINAPIISLFGHDDMNTHTFACSEVVHKIEMNAKIKEEDNCFYCHVTFFTEPCIKINHYNTKILLDYRKHHFSKSLKEIAKWWDVSTPIQLKELSKVTTSPVYSTWYQFHQNLDTNTLIEECKLVYDLGYQTIIIDDGWQTDDYNRGYDFTGDWGAKRLLNHKDFIQNLHNIGMKVGLWYSVPFCGIKSEAYKKFKGKFLTENHRWAPVLDPRYFEVREYLINKYKNALLNWGLDGFKLDFIDDFKLYPDTVMEQRDSMDFYSIDEAVHCLISDVASTLKRINPEIFIEFRQKYIGPQIKKYGNMLRAFDCPNDATMNRVRISDIKLIVGKSIVHSDMITWHPDEQKEVVALQIINTLFAVPQISMFLKKINAEHVQIIKFYTDYWIKNKEIFLYGDFIPYKPLENYPILQTYSKRKIITVLNTEQVVEFMPKKTEKNTDIDIINGKLSEVIVINCTKNHGSYLYSIYDCTGQLQEKKTIELHIGIHSIKAPPSGLVELKYNF